MNEAIVVLGKQQISQLTFFDYVLGITIGSIAASLTTDLSSRGWPHWIGLLIWTGAVYAMQIVTIKWRRASKYIDGEPTVVTELIYDGIIFDQNLKQVKLDRKWLESKLKKYGINDPCEVFLASLNTQGKLYIDKYEDHIT